MQIIPKIISAEVRLKQAGKTVVNVLGSSTMKAGKVAGRAVVSTSMFARGNIMGILRANVAAIISRPFLLGKEVYYKLTDSPKTKQFIKYRRRVNKAITTQIGDVYEYFGAPKSGEFLTQTVGDFAKKTGNTIKNLIRK